MTRLRFSVPVTIEADSLEDAAAYRDELAQRVEDMNDGDPEEVGNASAVVGDVRQLWPDPEV